MSHRASEDARRRAEASKKASAACEADATFLAQKRRLDAERAPDENACAWRWVANFRRELEAIAVRHGMEFGDVVRAAHYRVRWKRVETTEAVIADLNQLIERHSLYDAWSAEPPPRTYPTSVTIAVRPDEDARFAHHTWTVDDWLTAHDLLAKVEQIGEVVHASASAELRLGDLISVNVARTVDRRENERRWAEWKRLGSDEDRLPHLLPYRTTWFLRLTPVDVLEIPHDHPGQGAIVSYLIGRISLAEVLVALDRDDAIPEWLTIPGVSKWWQFPDPGAGVAEQDDTTRLEQFYRAWSSIARIFGDIEERSAQVYERIERALTPDEATEIRRLVIDEGQTDVEIGRGFRNVWNEYVAEVGDRYTSDEDIGKRLRAAVAAHFGEDAWAPPWTRLNAQTKQKRIRRQPPRHND